MRYALAIALAFMAAPALAVGPAPKVDTSGATSCELSGYLTDKDPKGTNVRGGPSATAPIVGHLPPDYSESGSDETFAVEFTIIGSKNGWLLIKDAQTGQYGDSPLKTVFAGPGWISGGLVGFTLGSTVLRAGPTKADKLVAKLSDDAKGYGADSYMVLRVYECRGSAVDVTAVLPPSIDKHAKPVRGWARHACGNQVTTCDAGGDSD
jgi:hypothetical protein